VKPYFAAFRTRWPTVADLAAAPEGDVMAAWAGLGYYARARNLLACARAVVTNHDGRFPDSEAALLTLPGIGAYTAAAIAAIAFGRRAVVVDGNVERVVSRLFAVETPVPAVRPELRRLTDTLTPDDRAGDFAQAMMDLGATICTPRNPACILCPLSGLCAARATGEPARFPIKAAKVARPQRHGTAFWLERDGAVLLQRRPAKGLLGGMLALPTGPWTTDDPLLADAPAATTWREAGHVTHVFTHFALDLRVVVGEGEGAFGQDMGEWWPIDRLPDAGLPTLFAKAAARAMASDERQAA
jgi:A/G-specific adenine glycosylase